MPFFLTTPVDPGTGNPPGSTASWTFVVPGGGVTPITGLTFVDATFVGASDGSIGAPFTTIQAALDAIGDATTVAEQFEGWKVIISAGFYDEDLVIPQRRSIVLDCAPLTVLSEPTLTTPRKITWSATLALIVGSPTESYGLHINNLIMLDGIELITAAPATAPGLELRLNQVHFNAGAGTLPAIDATGVTIGNGVVELRDSLLRDTGATGFCFNAGGNEAYISYANSCEFDAPISASGYGQMVNSTFTGNQTYTDQTSLGVLDRPEGFFGCVFDSAPHTFTMSVPERFRMDGVTWKSCLNTTFVGVTIESLDDEYVAGNTPAGDATWAAGGDNTLSNAIDRIANTLAIAIAGPIP